MTKSDTFRVKWKCAIGDKYARSLWLHIFMQFQKNNIMINVVELFDIIKKYLSRALIVI